MYFVVGTKGFGSHGPFIHKEEASLVAANLTRENSHKKSNYRPSFFLEEREWTKRGGVLALTVSSHYHKFSAFHGHLPSGRTNLKIKKTPKKRFSKE